MTQAIRHRANFTALWTPQNEVLKTSLAQKVSCLFSSFFHNVFMEMGLHPMHMLKNTEEETAKISSVEKYTVQGKNTAATTSDSDKIDTVIIDGKKTAQKALQSLQKQISAYKGRRPGLAFVRIGDNSSSEVYISMKKKKCEEIGILSFDKELAANTQEDIILKEIAQLNNDPLVDGILVQFPLPSHLNSYKIFSSIDPQKDVDGIHPVNMGKLLIGDHSGFIPCTPLGVHNLLINNQIPIEGRNIVIVGRSNILGKPLSAIFMQKAPHCNATVTIAHSHTKNINDVCRSADILIAAMGSAHFIHADMVRQGACVIDVGINKVIDAQGNVKIVGDVDFASVAPRCSHITPVPGGVGPMTMASLISNTFLSFQRRN